MLLLRSNNWGQYGSLVLKRCKILFDLIWWGSRFNKIRSGARFHLKNLVFNERSVKFQAIFTFY